MPPKKKGKGKKTKKQENRTDTLTEVDKTFYELQITDLNRKLSRLKQTAQELEDRNQQLENKLENLDEDRADVISYLKRTVTSKQSESLELQERVTALQETKDSESKEYEDKIEDLQLENKTMREQLTSEVKLLSGKLNALEEFRMQRDELMERFEQQEKTIQEHEMKEKKVMYEIEKKFIISKKAIASEMEKQLFNLANDFEKANEIRIAATTHRCIRENIVLNNELNKISTTLGTLNQQVEEYKSKNIELRLNCELYQAERNKTINELQVVRAHLDQMTKDFQSRVKILRTYEGEMKKSQKTYDEMKHAQARETALAAKVRILEQNLHSARCKGIDLTQLVEKQAKLVKHFQDINREVVISIEDCLKISFHPRLDEAGKQYRRELLLQNLLTILTQPKIDTHTVLSMETVDTIDIKYKQGDLGFLPKEVHHAKPKDFQLLNAAVQVTPRYEEMPLNLATSPEASRKSYQSLDDSQSYKSVNTMDSVQFQACSMLDIQDRSRSLFSSIVFPEKFISEMQINQMLSDTQLLSGNESFSDINNVSRDDYVRTDTILLDDDKKEIETKEVETEVENVEAVAEEEAAASEDNVSVHEDIENTVFGNDEDETKISDISPEDD